MGGRGKGSGARSIRKQLTDLKKAGKFPYTRVGSPQIRIKAFEEIANVFSMPKEAAGYTFDDSGYGDVLFMRPARGPYVAQARILPGMSAKGLEGLKIWIAENAKRGWKLKG